MKHYGLIGFPLTSSFSKRFFTEKFEKENIDAVYDTYPLENIEGIENLIKNVDLYGLNVTVPYKESVVKYLDELDDTAREIAAVNTVKFLRKNNSLLLKGYNTDVIGFENSLKNLPQAQHKKALILGTGGSSKAVAFVLKKMGIEFRFVSRSASNSNLCYEDLNEKIIKEHLFIINTTPLGMYPADAFPPIPYEHIGENHFLYDLIYNPEKTIFLSKGEARGASIKNGMEMLIGQALAAWEIWNEL